LVLGVGLLGVVGDAPAQTPTKNVILMIADGAGYNTFAGTSMYRGQVGNEVFNGPGWVQHPVSTYPLRTGGSPVAGPAGLAQDPTVVYNPALSWDTTPVTTTTGGFPDRFAGYRWNKTTAPDSANTIVSAMTGVKTYNAAVNVNGNGTPLVTFPQQAKAAGKSVGVVTTVQLSDATPSVSGGAHNVSRNNRTAIANEMLTAGTLDVIMGMGNPDYTNTGTLRPTPSYTWVGQTDWTQLKAGTHPSGFRLIQTRAEFDALAANAAAPTERLIGVAQSFDSHQFNRPGGAPATEVPFSVPLRTDVPTLPTMARGALNILDNNPNGMFLMIEGGAVDRAMHGNNFGRMVEEMSEFYQAVQTVSDYLTANTNGNNWSNTLVVVTADHDHLLLGPNSDTIPFQDLVNNGANNVPGYDWQHSSHSNRLLPLYARGPGSERFATFADQLDAHTDSLGRMFGRGLYLDQTEIYRVLLQATAVPEPSLVLTAAAGSAAAFALLRRRRAGSAGR
jgi:alkaline phosphatase